MRCKHTYVWGDDEPLLVCTLCGDMADARNGNPSGNVRDTGNYRRSVYKNEREHIDDLEDRLTVLVRHITKGSIRHPYTRLSEVLRIVDSLEGDLLRQEYRKGLRAGQESADIHGSAERDDND